MQPTSKTCARCGAIKPLEDFSPHRGQPLGRASYCRPCAAQYDRARRRDPAVRARNAEAQRVRRRTVEIGDRDRATSLAWKKRNPGKGSGTKEQRVQRSAVRRARKADAPLNDFTLEQWQEVLGEFGTACAYCLARGVPLQQDHVQALSRGGSHTKSNIVPACGPCNIRKGARSLLEFLCLARS